MNESIKTYVGYALILTMLVFSYATVSYVSTYSKSIEPSSFRSFTVSGEGKAVAKPDVAEFTFSVISEGGADVAALQKDNEERNNRVLAFLKEQGIAKDDIRTQSYNIEPRYEGYSCPPVIYREGTVSSPKPCPPPSIVGYTVRQTNTVKVRANLFAKLGEIVGGVGTNGANDVSQLSFTIDDPTAVESEARAEAIQKARAKAESIGRAGGFSVGRLLNIGEGGYYPVYRDFAVAEKAGGFDGSALPAPIIEPGSQEVRVSVTLTYEIR